MTRSPRRLREQVKDTVSELPIHAARLAVMGVGRALLLTDRVRKDYRDARESGLGPVLGRLKNDAENLTGTVVGKVAGNGRTAEEPKTRSGDSEISVGKPKAAGRPGTPGSSQRSAAAGRPSSAPPSRSAATARPKPAAAKPAAKAGTSKAGTSKAGTSKAGTSKAGTSKAGTSKAGTSKAGTAKATTPKPAAAKPTPKPAAKSATAKSSAAKAGTAKAEAPKASATKPKTAESKAAKPTESKPAETKATETKAATSASSGAKTTPSTALPLAAYDQATLASVRARLRRLDARQVTELRDYERAHAARADFLRMYENRLAKLRDER
jgi:hypothetical protein